MSGKRWFASVVAGTVMTIGLCGTPLLHAAEKKPARAGERLFGIVTAKTDKDITIKAEGDNDTKHDLLAPQAARQCQTFARR